ncbi:MAG TPA: hypothetical protein VGY98_19065, partial [Verrucomicrobiae bacterium]|nr:hypothetical protein [Verrucomicrobiae bacterium]
MQKPLPEAVLRITALTPRAFATVLAVVCSFVAANLARGQTWTLTGANTNTYWTSVASSADGTKLAATGNAGNGICLSTNSGVAWVTSSAPIVAWSSIASSSDGRRLIAAEGSVYISTNSGSTWNLSIPTGNRVASSADGSKLMVAQASGYGSGIISISTNAGVSWFLGTNNGTTLSRSWSTIACSADGTRMAAVVNMDDCPVFVSTNCGVTWHLAPGIIGQPGAAIACTADGSKLMLATAGMFYTSTSWGSTWSSTNYNAPFGDSMASSANGSTLMSVGFDSALDSSTNFGASWVSNNVPP